MKKNKIIKKFAKLSVYTLLVALGTGCTDKFEEYNTNPFGPKPDQMLGDKKHDSCISTRTTEQFTDVGSDDWI
jgi:hypothetical protein